MGLEPDGPDFSGSEFLMAQLGVWTGSGRVSSRFEKTDTLSPEYDGILFTQMENVYR